MSGVLTLDGVARQVAGVREKQRAARHHVDLVLDHFCTHSAADCPPGSGMRCVHADTLNHPVHLGRLETELLAELHDDGADEALGVVAREWVSWEYESVNVSEMLAELARDGWRLVREGSGGTR